MSLSTTSSALPVAANAAPRRKSKLLTVLLAFLFGSLGAYRFYLKGLRDPLGWAHLIATLLGVLGAAMLKATDFASLFGWATALIGVSSLVLAFLAAIVFGLRPDEQWDAQYNADGNPTHSGWPVVLLVILALLLGAGILMATLAFSFQSFFESQVEAARALSQ
jgi:TM2 domain-containing membrane protein YozV